MSKPTTRVLSFPEPSTARFELRCRGEFALFDRLLRQPCSPRGRKARAVIAYLAAQGGGLVNRERLAALLWSERGDQQARASLRQTLLELKPYTRGATGLVEIDRDHLRLNPLALTTDVARLEGLARSGDVDAFTEAVIDAGERLYTGLDGLDPAFDEWLALERRVQDERLVSLVLAAGQRGLTDGEYGAVSRLASEAQALDETNEAIAQIGMKGDYACGDCSALRRRYRRLCDSLRQELGVSPSAGTRALFEELTGAERPSAPAAPPAIDPPQDSLAAPPPQDPTQSPSEPKGSRFSWLKARAGRLGVALVLLAAVVGGGIWFARQHVGTAPDAPTRVAITPFVALDTDPASRALARRLQDQVTGVLEDNVVGLALVAGPSASKVADLKLNGTVSRDGGDWRVRTSLEDPKKGVTLWAREFKRPTAQESTLQLEAAVGAAEVIDDALEARREKAARRDPRALALVLQSSEAIKSPTLMSVGEPRRLLEEAVARAPDFASAHAGLALALFRESRMNAVGEQKALLKRASEEADAAIRLSPADAGSAYGARYLMARVLAPNDMAAAEDVLTEGSAMAPQFPYLYMFRCRFLTEVGLVRDAVPYCQRALALRPLASPLGYRYAEALYSMGAPQLATQAIDNAIGFHPEHMETRRVQFELAAFSGSPDAASTLLHRPGNLGACACSGPEGVRALDSYLAARKSGLPQDANRAVAELRTAVLHRQLHPRYLVFGAAALGRLDDAFAMLDLIAKEPAPLLAGDPGYLFEGPSAPLQRDPRFWPLAARAGYLQYWRKRGVWPDFCRDETLPYDCRAEAARLDGAAAPKAAR